MWKSEIAEKKTANNENRCIIISQIRELNEIKLKPRE